MTGRTPMEGRQITKRGGPDQVDGLLVVDKAAGMTSHDVVGRCRRIVGQRRIGHAGTLDPGATGVLLVGLGRATRLMRYVSELRKVYTGEVVLGRATTTLDDEGETVAIWDMSDVTASDVANAAAKFLGPIEQVPPMVSAIKVDGRRLHELARQGIEVERAPRPVTIYDIEALPTDEPGVFRLDVECSSGTYVRSLAADIGTALGGGAHLRRLRRKSIGPFDEGVAAGLDVLEHDWRSLLRTPAEMVGHLERAIADASTASAISHGKPLDRAALGVDGDGPWAVVDESGELLAVYESGRTTLRAAVVLSAR